MQDGILLPLITPFTSDGLVDEVALLALVDYAVEAGVHGLFLLGSQGQGPAMSVAERKHAADITIRHVAGQISAVVHVGTTDLHSTAELADSAQVAGADAIAAIAPYYYADHLVSEVDAHLLGAARSVDLPFIVYNNARYAGVDIGPTWLSRLADAAPNLAGVKLSFASPDRCLTYVRELPPRVAVYAGSVSALLPTVPFGVRGTINPPSVLFPRLAVAIWESASARDWTRAFYLQEAVNELAIRILDLVHLHGRQVYAEGLRLRGIPVQVFPRWEPGAELPSNVKDQLGELFEIEARYLS